MTRETVVDQPGANIALDLFVVGQHLGEVLDAALVGTGVTPAQYAVYTQLAQRDQTPGQLSATLGLRPATLSGYLNAMERRHDVTKRRGETDGRTYTVALTSRGRARVETCRPRFRRAVRMLEKELGDNHALARRMLGAVDDALRGTSAHLLSAHRSPHQAADVP